MKQIRKAFPPIFLKTQIIVGFAGETDEDFSKSRDLFKLDLFDFVDVVAYSKRRGTRGWSLPDEVPNEIISKRYKEILFRTFFQLSLRRCLSVCMLKRR
jgi:tRNA A37 methylthiotransferase MiaB